MRRADLFCGLENAGAGITQLAGFTSHQDNMLDAEIPPSLVEPAQRVCLVDHTVVDDDLRPDVAQDASAQHARLNPRHETGCPGSAAALFMDLRQVDGVGELLDFLELRHRGFNRSGLLRCGWNQLKKCHRQGRVRELVLEGHEFVLRC